MLDQPLIVLAGPTGVGKTELSLALAQRVGGEIVNYDSVQIYRGFDIGSAKPTSTERALVPHHLFDIVEPTEEYTAARYEVDATRVCAEIRARGATPVLTGGTFFYLRALLAGLPEMPPANETVRRRLDRINERPAGAKRLRRWLARVDPASAARIASNDWHRVQRALEVYLVTGRAISSWRTPGPDAPRKTSALVFGLQIERERLRERLQLRSEAMFHNGLIEETENLLARYPATARPFGSIGYREAVRCVAGEMSVEDAIAETTRRTLAYAKRQMTWLRAERDVAWLDVTLGLERMLTAIIDRWKQGSMV